MKIKKGDKVQLLAGKDKGKTGKVLQVSPTTGLLSVEGVNLRFKNVRGRKQNEKGQRIQYPGGMPIGRVALVCPKCGKTTRVGYSISKDGKKSRICKKCKELI